MASSLNGQAVKSAFATDPTPSTTDQDQSQAGGSVSQTTDVHTQILGSSPVLPAASSASLTSNLQHAVASPAAAGPSGMSGWTAASSASDPSSAANASLVSFTSPASTNSAGASQPTNVTSAPSATLTGTAGGLQINLIWDSSVSSAPAGFQQAIIQAANMLDAAFSNNIVLNFDVGYGEIAGQAVSSNTSEGGAAAGIWQSISTVKNELTGTTAGTVDASAPSSIDVTQNPNSGVAPSANQIAVWGGQQKAFGLLAANGTEIDGEVGFGSAFTGNTLIAGALHELAHAMGRISGYSPYGILDLYRYSAQGTHVYAGPAAAYFSLDGGKTVLANYDTTSDYGDFAANSLTTNDPFNAYVSPNMGALTQLDLETLGAIGYTIAGSGGGGGGGGGNGTGPDLVASNLALSANSVAPGANLKLSFKIANNGSASAGASQAAVYLDGKQTALTTNAIAALAAGGSTSISDTISTAGLTVGTHTLTVTADATNLVTESSETNNSSTITFNVAAAQLPDLIAQNLKTNVSTVAPGGSLALSFSIADKGLSSAGQSLAEVFIDGSTTPIARNAINAMAANGSISVTDSISTAGLSVGTHTLTVTADATNQITESNETNNSTTISFTVAPPAVADLTVNSITSSATKVLHGARLNFSYSVEDVGGASARSSWAGVYLDGHTNAVASNQVAALATGASAIENNSILTTGLSIGQHTLTIVADATNIVGDANKANNSRSITFNVV